MLLYTDAQFVSPYAMSVFVAMKEKGMRFEMKAINLDKGEQAAAEYAASSLTQRVPTLVDGDFFLSESSAITEYLDEIHPQNKVYPTDPKAKARARQVQAWLRSDLLPLRQERSTEVVFYGPIDRPLSEAARAAANKLFCAANTLLSRGGPNICGDWCIADIDLALMLNRLVLNGDAVPANLAAYARRQWERPAVQEWVKLPRAALA